MNITSDFASAENILNCADQFNFADFHFAPDNSAGGLDSPFFYSLSSKLGKAVFKTLVLSAEVHRGDVFSQSNVISRCKELSNFGD